MEEGVVQEQKIVAVALIRDGMGRILVQRRVDPRHHSADGKWEFPGGRVDFGEAPAHAAVREALEEAGVHIVAERVLPVILSRVWDRSDGGKVHTIVVCFECRLLGGTAQPKEEWVSEVAWCTAEEIAMLDCLEGIPVFLAASAQRLAG